MANKPIIYKSAAFASADSKILKYFNIMRQLHPVLQALVYEYHDGVKEAIHRFCQQQNSKSIDESSECIYSDRVPRPTVLGTGPGVYETRRWWIIESVSSNLERYSEVIAEECEILMSSSLPGGYQDIPVCASAQKDAWRLFYLMEEGVWNKTNCSKCPVLTSLLQHNLKGKLCECSFGYAYFSRLRPGTDIAPHFGPTNFKLRLQLPLLLPTQRSAIMMQSEQPSESEIFKGCFIQCGGAKREYFPGKALIFDDSFAHSVVNQSAYERVVLIVDVWHPQLSRSAISAITSYFNPIETRIDDGHFPILPRREGVQSDEYDYLVKALCIGDNNAGKSSFVLRFADNTFHGGYMSTIGVDFKIRVLNVKNTLVKVQIWDVAGPERFRTITASYFKGAHVIFTFVDTTDDESLTRAEFWLNEIRKYASTDVVVLLVATKIDLVHERKISFDELQGFSQERKVPFMETSSKTGEGLHQAVDAAIKMKLYQLSRNFFASPPLPVPSGQQEKVKDKSKEKRKCLVC